MTDRADRGAGGGAAWWVVEQGIRDLRADVRDLPVATPVDRDRLRARLQEQYGFEQPMELDEVAREVIGLLREASVHVIHPRYFGLFNPSVREAGILADTIVAGFNPQLAVWSHAPAAQELERHVLRRLASVLGLDPDGIYANFTSGGAEANLTAVLAALARLPGRWVQGGVAALERRPVIYLTGQSHHSLVKIAHMVGLGADALREVATTATLEMDPACLRERIREDQKGGRLPLLVVGTAGGTATGHIDPLAELAAVAAEHDVWLHVDAAWGAAAAFSPELQPLLSGIERADSVTWDAHKWMSVPMGAGMFFCRHPEALRRAFSVSTSYMPESGDRAVAEPYAMTCQWSRRAIGIKVFMSLAELGIDGYRELVEHQTRMGELLRRCLEESGWLVVNRTVLPVVCFTHSRLRDGSVATGGLVGTVQDRGRVWISEITLPGGERVLRACVTSYLTEPGDVEALVAEVETVLYDLAVDEASAQAGAAETEAPCSR